MCCSFHGKSVLVTGGARGIGREIALEFARHGADLIINYHRAEQEAEELKQQITSLGVACLVVQADLSDPTKITEMFKEISQKTNSIDILINNAGILQKKYLFTTTVEEWNEVIDTNLRSAFFCMKHASRLMMRKKYGNIINIISTITQRPLVMQSVYAASKSGLIGLTKAAAKELGPSNIRVNAVSPGPIKTDMNSLSVEDVEFIKQNTPLRRMTESMEVAKAVLLLCSDYAKAITGQILVADGGLSL